MPRKLTTEEFIQKAISVHGDKFNYSQVEYSGYRTKVTIICPKHGLFDQPPGSHIKGHGCPSCYGNRKSTTEEFIQKAVGVHEDKYDYSSVEYMNNSTNVTIICPKHGIFKVLPNNHLIKRSGCPSCYGNIKLTTEEFIQKAVGVHGDKYDYSSVEYVNALTKVSIICPKHGSFNQTPASHMNGHGCPSCKSSKGETLIANLLILHSIPFHQEYKFIDCVDKAQLPFDFYLPNHNTCIEFDGIQHYEAIGHFGGHVAFMEQQRKDAIKNAYCEDNGIKLVRIPYTDIDNIDSLLEGIITGHREPLHQH